MNWEIADLLRNRHRAVWAIEIDIRKAVSSCHNVDRFRRLLKRVCCRRKRFLSGLDTLLYGHSRVMEIVVKVVSNFSELIPRDALTVNSFRSSLSIIPTNRTPFQIQTSDDYANPDCTTYFVLREAL